MRPLFSIALAVAGLLCAGPGLAGEAAAPFLAAQFGAAATVGAATLDACRGGFVTPTGMAVTLGIERVVRVDGQVLARTELQFGELGRLTSGATALDPQAAGRLSLLRDGAAGVAVQMGPSLLGGTVIQNSLNNQRIDTATIINASVDAHGALQTMQFQSTLAHALQLSVGAR